MDRNRLVGLILISGILIFYTHFFGPKPTPITSPENNSTPREAYKAHTLPAKLASEHPTIFTQAIPSTDEQEVILENDEVKITLSSQGGRIKHVLLKKFQDHQRQPLVLLDEQSNNMGFQFTFNNLEVNTSKLYFETIDKHQYVQGESLGIATFTSNLGPGQYIRQIFTLPSQGYELSQEWELVGLEKYIDQGIVNFVWHDLIKRTENDLQACRNKSTINYYLADHSFNHLKEHTDKQEIKTIDSPIKWLAIKQRFFTAGIVAQDSFSNGHIALLPTLHNTSIVKEAQIWLKLPAPANQESRQGKWLFYFGPNKLNTLQGVTPGFSKNLSLGWPIVKWINQFLIIPIFAFLEQYIHNYGLIILLLVVFIKILILPLSYKSYISMAEMKVLKPALDAIKDQHANNLQKMQIEQAKLYKEMGINPLSGCIPVFLQMPILLAMFNFFPNAIELRQKAFLWAQDLSTYDEIINLPFKIPAYGSHVSLFTLLMTASTILYTWSNNQVNAPQGPMKTMSYLLPITFMFVLNSFPAGLSFYYFLSNLITFGQQTLIKRFVDDEKIKDKLAKNKQENKAGNKATFKSRLQEAIRNK